MTDQMRGVGKDLNTLARGGNRFRFQTFSDRLMNMDIDVHHRMVDKSADLTLTSETDTTFSYFQRELDLLSETNATAAFVQLHSQLQPLAMKGQLAQILHHSQTIVSLLTQHLHDCSLIPDIVTLISALARDLRAEFVPSLFNQCVDAMVMLFINNTNQILINHEAIESIFSCFGYLFKFLAKYLIPIFTQVYTHIQPLLFHPTHGFIREFAAQSLAFLIRKVIALSQCPLHQIFLNSQVFEEGLLSDLACESLGMLVFETMNGIQNALHSCATTILTTSFNLLGSHPIENIGRILSHALHLTICHVSKESAEVVWQQYETAFTRPMNEPLLRWYMDQCLEWIVYPHSVAQCNRRSKKGERLWEDADRIDALVEQIAKQVQNHLNTMSKMAFLLFKLYEANVCHETVRRIIHAFGPTSSVFISELLTLIESSQIPLTDLFTSTQTLVQWVLNERNITALCHLSRISNEPLSLYGPSGANMVGYIIEILEQRDTLACDCLRVMRSIQCEVNYAHLLEICHLIVEDSFDLDRNMCVEALQTMAFAEKQLNSSCPLTHQVIAKLSFVVLDLRVLDAVYQLVRKGQVVLEGEVRQRYLNACVTGIRQNMNLCMQLMILLFADDTWVVHSPVGHGENQTFEVRCMKADHIQPILEAYKQMNTNGLEAMATINFHVHQITTIVKYEHMPHIKKVIEVMLHFLYGCLTMGLNTVCEALVSCIQVFAPIAKDAFALLLKSYMHRAECFESDDISQAAQVQFHLYVWQVAQSSVATLDSTFLQYYVARFYRFLHVEYIPVFGSPCPLVSDRTEFMLLESVDEESNVLNGLDPLLAAHVYLPFLSDYQYDSAMLQSRSMLLCMFHAIAILKDL